MSLGLDYSTANWAQIKEAHRTLSFRWHPDKNPTNIEEATERFKDIQGAFDELKKYQTGGRHSIRKKKKDK